MSGYVVRLDIPSLKYFILVAHPEWVLLAAASTTLVNAEQERPDGSLTMNTLDVEGVLLYFTTILWVMLIPIH